MSTAPKAAASGLNLFSSGSKSSAESKKEEPKAPTNLFSKPAGESKPESKPATAPNLFSKGGDSKPAGGIFSN